MRFILVSILCLRGLAAGGLETQQIVDTTMRLGERFSATAHFRVRSMPNRLGVYQSRSGPIVQYSVVPGLNVIAGYYFTRFEAIQSQPWKTVHRVFAGGEKSLCRTPRWAFDTRAILERYYSRTDPEFNRFRHRFRMQSTARVGPYTAYEYFLDASGFRSARYFGGVRARMGRMIETDFGYFFETRRPALGGNRHMVSTSFTLKPQAPR